MSLGPYLYFAGTLALCAGALLVFCRVTMAGIRLTLMNAPPLVFFVVYFLAAPLLNVAFDAYVDERAFSRDPVASLALLNVVNAVLLLVAAGGARLVRSRLNFTFREISVTGLQAATLAVLLVTVPLGVYQIYVGGEGLGQTLAIFALVECTPLVFCWLVTAHFVGRGRTPDGLTTVLIIVMQVLLTLAFSASRGSRVAVLSQLLFAFQIYNTHIYRLKLRDYLAGFLAVFLFIQTYAYFKYSGIDALRDYVSGQGADETAQKYNTVVGFIIGDLGRADIQAPLISRYLDGSIAPNWYGETYLAAASLVLPPERRPNLRSKANIGAEAQLDPGGRAEAYVGVVQDEFGSFVSSRIYGLLGEAILNFGWVGPIVAFLLFGMMTRFSFVFCYSIRTLRHVLLAPLVAIAPIYLLFYDSDNILVQYVSVWLVPTIVFLAIDRLVSRRAAPA